MLKSAPLGAKQNECARMNDLVMTGATPEELWPLIRDHHYSKRMPSVILHCYCIREPGGLFGDTGRIIAGIIFSIPSTQWKEKVIELSRLIKIPKPNIPLSSLIAFACQQLKLRGGHLLISYADWDQYHHGGVYQASGWHFSGINKPRAIGLIVDGKKIHGRTCNHIWGTMSKKKLQNILPLSTIEEDIDNGKYLYWRSLTIAGKTRAKRLNLKSLPYLKPNAACPLDERVPTRASLVQEVN